jgi:hypothetical protein
MAIHWKIPFKSLRSGTDYVVNIYDSSYTGSAIVLEGGAQPFVTQEADDEDEFTPIRTQTGYIRIIDHDVAADGVTAFNWKDLLPVSATSRPVTLTTGNTVVWRGYIQPQTFSGVLYGNPQQREFPICCPLSLLQSFDFDPGVSDIISFGELLSDILEKTSDFSGAVIQGGNVIDSWLQKAFSTLNLLEEAENDTIQPKYSYYSVLEDVCRFFGWTCRYMGVRAYFTCADDLLKQPFLYYDTQGLYNTGRGSTGLGTEVSWQTVTLGNIFASTSNDDTVVPGIRKATITADINESPEVIEVPYDRIAELYAGNSVTTSTYGTQTTKYLFTKKAAVANEHTLTFPWVVIDFAPGGSFTDQGQTYYYFASEHIYEYYEDALTYKHSYNFTTNIYIQGDHPNDGYLVAMRTRSGYSLSDGMIVISARSYIDAYDTTDDYKHITYIGNGSLYATLKIGNKYWNGTAWQTSWAEFEIPIGEEGSAVNAIGTGGIITNRTLASNFPDYEGFGVPVSGSLGGIVEFAINGFNDAAEPLEHGRRGLAVENLKIQFLRPFVAGQQDRNVYQSAGSNEFTDEPTYDLIFATDNNNQFGCGIILNADGSYCSGIAYPDGTTQHPEQHTVNRMGTFYQRTRRLIHTEVLSNLLGSISPAYKLTIDGTIMHPIAISRNWRDDVTRLALLETVPVSEPEPEENT